MPQGVSGAIKRAAGTGPFKEVAKHGMLPLGAAVLTSAGKLSYRGIIHVAGINAFWRASEFSIRESVKNALKIVADEGFRSVAFPLIGGSSGGFNPARSKELILDEVSRSATSANVLVVEWRK